MYCRCRVTSRLTRVQVRLAFASSLVHAWQGACGTLWDTVWRTGVIMSASYPYVCFIGLYITYPTSYEALVGRGKLREIGRASCRERV